MPLWTIGAGIPLLFFALALPLALQLVPPNRWFGFPTPSPANWHRTNRAFGLSLLLAALFSALINAALAVCFADGPTAPLSLWMSNQSIGWIILACIPPWLVSRRPV